MFNIVAVIILLFKSFSTYKIGVQVICRFSLSVFVIVCFKFLIVVVDITFAECSFPNVYRKPLKVLPPL